MTDLRLAVWEAIVVGLASAREQLEHGEANIDTVQWWGHDQPDQVREGLLEYLLANTPLVDDDLSRTGEALAIPADRKGHIEIVQRLRQHFPHCYVVGQMATKEEWASAEGAPTGSLIFSVDAIDGSLPYEALTFGYGVNILAFRRGGQVDELLLSAVGNASLLLAMYERDSGHVSAGNAESYDSLHVLGAPLTDAETRTRTVAVLGATRTHRGLVRPLLDDPDLTVFTTGGAPASLGLIFGRLETLIAPEPQTMYDAAYLPILAALRRDIEIVTADRTLLTLNEVLTRFGSVARSPADRHACPIPAFVASRNFVLATDLAATVFAPRPPEG